jgi:hypothetical protein
VLSVGFEIRGITLPESLWRILISNDLEFVQDLSQLSLHDCDVDVDEGSVDWCGATSRLRPRFQGDLVAVALDPLP